MDENIDSQRNGLETQAKAPMLVMLHPWYGLIRFTFGSCNFTKHFLTLCLNVLKKTAMSSVQLSTFKTLLGVTKLKINTECLHYF